MSVRNGCFRILGLSLLSPLVFAADIPGSQDLPAVARQVDSQIVDYRPAEDKERIYPMGAIRKISGQLRYEGQATARGQATAITYELPAEHSASAAFTATREALQEKGAQLLFWCKARDCGESSLWANEIFGNAKLVGADSQQEYLLLRLAETDSLVALYSITAVIAAPLSCGTTGRQRAAGRAIADLGHPVARAEKHRRAGLPRIGSRTG